MIVSKLFYLIAFLIFNIEETDFRYFVLDFRRIDDKIKIGSLKRKRSNLKKKGNVL